MEATPFLSIVVASRNDDHGGGLLGRMQTFVDALAAQVERHGLDVELVVVEWNPPPGRPGLSDAISWPSSEALPTRIVCVPPEMHARIENARILPFHQMIAKNVGLRRARGTFALATNVDVVLSDALAGSLLPGRLDPSRQYAAVRHDADIVPIGGEPLDDLLGRCAAATIAVRQTRGTIRVAEASEPPIHGRFTSLPKAIGVPLRAVTYAPALLRDLAAGTVGGTRGLRARLALELARVDLHTNACGDFTLLPRAGWDALRGYPELPIYPVHLDSLLVYEAHYAGFSQEVLPGPLFHLDHGDSYGRAPTAGQEALDRVRNEDVPFSTDDDLARWIVDLHRGRRPVPRNGEDWGLADVELRERSA